MAVGLRRPNPPQQAPTPSPADRPGAVREDFWIAFGLACGVLSVYIPLVLWLDNTNLVTTNGLWKLPLVQEWENFRRGGIDPSNFLYFPITGLGITLIPSRLFGEGWVRLSILNCGWAALAVSAIYLTCRGIGLPRPAALAAAFAQAGFAFFFVLAVTSEDIMGGYALLCITVCLVVLASRSHDSHSLIRWAIAGASFSFTFLWEWRLLFPTLPALMLAILVSEGRLRQRFLGITAFFGGFVSVLTMAAALWRVLEPSAGSLISRGTTLLWTGKATQSGWAGWSPAKLWFLLIGVTQYPVGGRNISSLHTDVITNPQTYIVALIIGLLLAGLTLWTWRHRNSAPARVGAVSVAITFLAGCVMNLWSQPQDPQMQLNVMMFLPISLGAATHLALQGAELRWTNRGARRRLTPAIGVAACLLGPILLSVNVWGPGGYAESRGGDDLAVDRAGSLFATTNPTRSVYVVQGFEGEITWMNVLEGIEWELRWPPPPTPHAKLIALASAPVGQPQLSAADTADWIFNKIHQSLQAGYHVYASPFWSQTKPELIGSLRVVAREDKALAIYDRLHSSFCAEAVPVGWQGESFFRLTPMRDGVRCLER